MVHPHWVVAAYSCTSRRKLSIGSPHISFSPERRPPVKRIFHFPACISGRMEAPAAAGLADEPFFASAPLAAGGGAAWISFDPGQGSFEYEVLPSLPTHLWLLSAFAPMPTAIRPMPNQPRPT